MVRRKTANLLFVSSILTGASGDFVLYVVDVLRLAASLGLDAASFFWCGELTDGRILVVEHKGEIYSTNDDSKEKCNVGAPWEEKSGGKALYLMTVVERGKPSLFEQIAERVG